jgi:hypothetical protein
MNLSSYDYTTSDEEFDIEEKEDIAMVLALHAHKNKRLKHGGPVNGRSNGRLVNMMVGAITEWWTSLNYVMNCVCLSMNFKCL